MLLLYTFGYLAHLQMACWCILSVQPSSTSFAIIRSSVQDLGLNFLIVFMFLLSTDTHIFSILVHIHVLFFKLWGPTIKRLDSSKPSIYLI